MKTCERIWSSHTYWLVLPREVDLVWKQQFSQWVKKFKAILTLQVTRYRATLKPTLTLNIQSVLLTFLEWTKRVVLTSQATPSPLIAWRRYPEKGPNIVPAAIPSRAQTELPWQSEFLNSTDSGTEWKRDSVGIEEWKIGCVYGLGAPLSLVEMQSLPAVVASASLSRLRLSEIWSDRFFLRSYFNSSHYFTPGQPQLTRDDNF